MAQVFAYESWVGSETVINGDQSGSSWDICQLGVDFLPGVITIEDFEIGRDVDVQKRRKKEKARLRDNGISPCAFTIICELTARQWHKWLEIRPRLQPKEGGVRTPLAIVHPLPNSHDVRNIYVHKIQIGSPSARSGMKITIRVGEWFEEEKDVVATTKAVPKSVVPAYSPPNYFADPNKTGKTLANNAGLSTVSPEDMMSRVMGGGGATGSF